MKVKISNGVKDGQQMCEIKKAGKNLTLKYCLGIKDRKGSKRPYFSSLQFFLSLQFFGFDLRQAFLLSFPEKIHKYQSPTQDVLDSRLLHKDGKELFRAAGLKLFRFCTCEQRSGAKTSLILYMCTVQRG